MADSVATLVVEQRTDPDSTIVTAKVAKYVVKASTCAKIALLSFGIGLIVGFNVNKRVRRFASRMLRKLKEP